MNQSENIAEIAGALAKAQGEIQPAEKSGANPAFKRDGKESKYATLESTWEACRAALSKNGIAVVQSPGMDDNGAVTLTTTLCHSSGQWMVSQIACKPAAATAQAIGSTITYLRRYSLASMVGVAPADDDGNEASGTLTPASAKPTVRAGKPVQNAVAAETPFDDGPVAMTAAEADKFEAHMRTEGEKAVSWVMMTELWNDNKPRHARLHMAFPNRANELFDWFKETRASKPKDA